MYCRSCGRPIEHHCSCIKENPIKKWEVIIIYFLVSFTPMAAIMTFKSYDVLRVCSIVLAALLVLITFAEMIFKRPYLALFFGCHQKSNRSFIMFKHHLPICSRCTGIYIGVLASFIFHLIFNPLPWYIYILMGIPLLIDGFIQEYKKIPSTNIRRVLTGIFFGFTLVFIYAMYFKYLIMIIEIFI